jgi:hypothetical protein
MSRAGSRDPRKLKQGSPPPRVFSTTLGRAKFPEFIQMTYGEKAVVGFDRYGKILAALAPMDAVKMLAGRSDEVDPHTRAQIVRAASELLDQAPAEPGLAHFARGEQARAPRATIELDQIEERRRRRAELLGAPRRRRKAMTG